MMTFIMQIALNMRHQTSTTKHLEVFPILQLIVAKYDGWTDGHIKGALGRSRLAMLRFGCLRQVSEIGKSSFKKLRRVLPHFISVAIIKCLK